MFFFFFWRGEVICFRPYCQTSPCQMCLSKIAFLVLPHSIRSWTSSGDKIQRGKHMPSKSSRCGILRTEGEGMNKEWVWRNWEGGQKSERTMTEDIPRARQTPSQSAHLISQCHQIVSWRLLVAWEKVLEESQRSSGPYPSGCSYVNFDASKSADPKY